jgi:replicative DNA helicase
VSSTFSGVRVPVVPPHDYEAEQAVLGAALLAPEAAQMVAEVDANIFYPEKHRLLASAIGRLVQQSQPVDVLTVKAELIGADAFDDAGGDAALAILADAGCLALNTAAYLGIVRERAARRELLRLGLELTTAAGDATAPQTETLINQTLTRLMSLDTTGGDAIVTPKRFADELRAAPTVPGLSTGISLIDDLCDGLRAGNLVVIAGRPAMGKTALASQITHELSLRKGLPILFCSLEMTRTEIGIRLLALETEVRAQFLRSHLGHPDRVATGLAAIEQSGFHITDEAAPTLNTIQAHLRRACTKHQVVAAVVDHIGKIQTGRRESRYLEVGEIAQGLKSSAKQLGIPVIALAQLNRLVERRNSPRPQLADLRDSGNIEEEADAVVFVWTAEERHEGKDPLEVNLYLAKNRHGETGERPYLFRKAFGRFEERRARTEPAR